MQNGVEAGAMLARALGDAAVMDGLAKVIAELVAPGHIRHVAVTPVLEFGARAATPADAPARAQLAPFAAALEAAGLRGIVHADMAPAMWEKFLFIEPFGTVGAVTRAPLGVMRRVPESRALLDACLREVFALAHAAGVAIGEEAITRVWARYDALPPESTASMQRDLMAGRPSEFSLQTGSVVRLAREHGVAVPVHEILYAALLPGAQA
jgi:2-dehydropantoate 2-reductase